MKKIILTLLPLFLLLSCKQTQPTKSVDQHTLTFDTENLKYTNTGNVFDTFVYERTSGTSGIVGQWKYTGQETVNGNLKTVSEGKYTFKADGYLTYDDIDYSPSYYRRYGTGTYKLYTENGVVKVKIIKKSSNNVSETDTYKLNVSNTQLKLKR